MSEENTELVQAFMEEDSAQVRAELLKRRVEGDTSTQSEMVTSLRKKFPGMPGDLVRRLESERGYIDDLILDHETSMAGKMKEIYNTVTSKAVEGDIGFAKLYFSLLKDRAPVTKEAPKNVTNNILVTSKDPGDMYAQFKRAAERVGSDTESPSE